MRGRAGVIANGWREALVSACLGAALIAGTGRAAAPQDAEDLSLSAVYEIAGEELVELTVVGSVPGIEERAREMARCLANMPPEHRRFIVPIYVVPTLPGGRAEGAGFYPKEEAHGTSLSIWLDRAARTGIPNSVIEEDLGRDIPGVVAITHSRLTATPRIHDLSITHEMAHAVQTAGLALTSQGVSVGQLAQRYPTATLREHEAEAYSRWISRPGAVCRQSELPRGESMAQCTARVVSLLRASPAFENVNEDWSPLEGCMSNEALDVPIATDEDEAHSGDTDVSEAEAVAGLPRGKGMFLQRLPRESVTAFVDKLGRADIHWLALPARVSLDSLRAIVEAFRASRDGAQVFIWRGGQEQNTEIPAQVESLVDAAAALSATGIILDPERHFNPNVVGEARAAAASRELLETARRLAGPHGLSVGVTSFPSFPGIEAFTAGDYGMPQIYDRNDTQPDSYPRQTIERWQRTFDVVVPLLGNYHCTSDGGCSSARPKTEEELSRLIAETEPPNGAVGWFRWGFARDAHFPILADLAIAGGSPVSRRADSTPETPSTSSFGSASELHLIGRDGDYIVFNRDAFRREVVDYVWDGYEPRGDELFSRGDLNGVGRTDGGLALELGDTHWEIARGRPGFNNPRLRTAMRAEFRRELERAPDLTDEAAALRASAPSWMPPDVWTELLAHLRSAEDDVYVFEGRSPSRTGIVGVVRDGSLGAYAEMIEDVDRLYAIEGVVPPGELEAITGQSSPQAAVRWLAEANAEYNRFMLREVRAGRSVREARRRYQQEAHTRLITTILESIQRGVGPGTSREAEAAVNAFQFIMGLVGSASDDRP